LIKIDLSQLDQTGLGHSGTPTAIYMLGYAASSGQILQQDPGSQKIFLGPPQPSNLSLPAAQFTVSGNQLSLSTSANLFVGGSVQFSGGGSSTITGIAANVVCANQPVAYGAFAPYTNPSWQTGANAVVLGPASINQGSVDNASGKATVSGVPSVAGSASGVGPGDLLTGYFPPKGGMPAANAAVSGAGAVTGFSDLENNLGCYQFAPTVSFPGANVTVVAVGTCTLDSKGYVNGVSITNGGSGYVAGQTYAAVFSAAPGNTYFLPTDANGFPGTDSASDAASVTEQSVSGGLMSLALSQPTDQPSWATPSPIPLGSAAINVFCGGTNASGYATLASFVASPTTLTTANACIADLPSTQSVQGFNSVLGSAGSSLMVSGVAGSVMIYSVIDYTITLADAVPHGITEITFSNSVDAQVSTDGLTLTISLSTYAGIAAALAIGQQPAIQYNDVTISSIAISSLTQGNGSLVVGLNAALPANFQGEKVTLALPPTGGTLPAIAWDAQNNNAIWIEQTPGAAGTMSVNGARIYFVLDTLNLGPPSFGYSVGVDADGNEVVTVVQPPDALVWQGLVSPFQYIELTADSLPQSSGGGDGQVYVDLSAVDGFFFPAALSTTVGTTNLQLGQPWQAYTAPNETGPTTYAAVSRSQILAAWKSFFTASNFSNADDLQGAYAALAVSSGVGIQNPSFAYAAANSAIAGFDDCWNDALDALFVNSNEIDLVGDLTIGGDLAYYLGTQTVIDGQYHAIQFVEYQGAYGTRHATGASFWVFDPRTPPPTEGQAFVQAGIPMSVGYQIFANTGVFASSSLVQGGSSPNYTPGTPAWSPGDALMQLLALQRDIVTALNRGVAALGIGNSSPTAGGTSAVWNTESNWYPVSAPFGPKTAQNLFAQWVHTAVIDASNNVYYATYPFGNVSGYGEPTQSAGGAYMNQTYGFGYDETPNGAANVPSKFLPIANTVGSTLTFSLVFGPWGS
jgi:hypothetical protein